jgi:carbonic anhydrase
MHVQQALNPEEIAHVRALFQEYAQWLGVDLSFQGFENELATLPGPYAGPRGRLLLGTVDGRAAGCVALRPLEEAVCEMKRLFVRPEFRRAHLGRFLVMQLLRHAREIGYTRMRLDTLDWMTPAIAFYKALGFTPCPPYYNTPLPNTVFMELHL